MSWIARFRIKNALIIANLISNAIGVTVVNLLAQMSNPAIPERLSRSLERTTLWFKPAAFLFPLALSLIYESMWIAAAVIYSAVAVAAGAESGLVHSILLRSLLTGLITVTVAFFVFEFVLQRRVAPHVFPAGGLYMTSGTKRVDIRTRLVYTLAL